jgi:hypothetical protein
MNAPFYELVISTRLDEITVHHQPDAQDGSI